MKVKKSIVVNQIENKDYDPNQCTDDHYNPFLIYQVIETVNTLDVSLGEDLPPHKIQSLISRGTTVKIRGSK